MSFDSLAKRTGVSKSSLHRYCAGTKLASSYAPIHAMAKACGAGGEELRELHALWAIADSSTRTAVDPKSEGPVDGGDSQADRLLVRSGRLLSRAKTKWNQSRRIVRAGIILLLASALTSVAFLRGDHTSKPSTNRTAYTEKVQPVSVHVFNVEGDCRQRQDHIPACSMGLARNPRLKYDADNVVAHRVWHNDILVTDCVLYDGDRVADETGVGTTRWFRVELNGVPGGHAWLPAVRTRDSPALPRCT